MSSAAEVLKASNLPSKDDDFRRSTSIDSTKSSLALVGSSDSELSEDDTPLLERLPINKRPSLAASERISKREKPKKGGFVIPRKKKQTKELLQDYDFNTREGKELVRNIQQSFRDPALGATYKFEKLQLVHNEKFIQRYHEKKQAMRSECRLSKELEDKYAFMFCTNSCEVKIICKDGLVTGARSLSSLGDPEMGVYLCRHAELITRLAPVHDDSGYLVVFKVLKGRVKTVTERNTKGKLLLEPTPNFDCHVSKSYQSLPPTALHSQAFVSSQLYFYEFAEEGDDLHVKRPRQCLPFAVISYVIGSPSDPQVPQEMVSTQVRNCATTLIVLG